MDLLSDILVGRPQLPELAFLGFALLFCLRARNRALKPKTLAKSVPVNHTSPGWVARRRARGGVSHPEGGAAIGYGSAFHRVSLTAREFGLGGLGFGAPGSGKTTLATLLVQALERSGTAGVILDPKPSRDLAEAVTAAGGTIWTLGGALAWDALPDDPTELANTLVEVEPETPTTRVYRNAARLQALAVGQYLQRKGEHPTLERMATLMQPGVLTNRPEAVKLSQTEWEGVRSFGTSLQILSRGAAGRSLARAGATDALKLDTAIASGRLVLFQLDYARYPEETRQLGAWVLRAMLRLLRAPHPCWLIADEFARLGWQGRHALDLLALGREFRKSVVLLSQGPSDFNDLGPHALKQAAQDAAWILCFRQGTGDSDIAARLLGVHRVDERSVTYGTSVLEHVRVTEQPMVPASVLEDLGVGDAYLRVPPIQRRHARVEPVRVAMPNQPRAVEIELVEPGTTVEPTSCGSVVPESEKPLLALVPQCDDARDAEVPDPRIRRYAEHIGEHWVWKQSAPSNRGYARLKIDGKPQYVHIWWWELTHGQRPVSDDGELLQVDHACEYRERCVAPWCKRLLSQGDNIADRWARARGDE